MWWYTNLLSYLFCMSLSHHYNESIPRCFMAFAESGDVDNDTPLGVRGNAWIC